MRSAFWIVASALLASCSTTPVPFNNDPLEPAPLAETMASGLPWTTLQNGSSGRDVVTAQYLLRARGQTLSVDGDFGNGTKTAVQNFQRANSLSVTGTVNADTWEKLIRTVENGSSGDAVRAVQDQLKNDYGFSISIDGVFGNTMKIAVQNFQRARDFDDDGVVGQAIWSALVTNKAAVKLSNSTARSRLSGASIAISSSGNCSDRDNASCTALEQVRAASIRGAISLKSVSGCSLTVTGGTETGHSGGTYSHYNGYKLDFALNTCINNYVQNNFTYTGQRSDGAALYRDARGDIYAKESNHWDVLFY
jgi:peptidoglycan hydrolase-like protein with peptidoglycan-binding domain